MGEGVGVVPSEARSVVDDPQAIFEMAKKLGGLKGNLKDVEKRRKGFIELDSWLQKQWKGLEDLMINEPESSLDGGVYTTRSRKLSENTSLTERHDKVLMDRPATLALMYEPDRNHDVSITFYLKNQPHRPGFRICDKVEGTRMIISAKPNGDQEITTEELILSLNPDYQMESKITKKTQSPTYRRA